MRGQDTVGRHRDVRTIIMDEQSEFTDGHLQQLHLQLRHAARLGSRGGGGGGDASCQPRLLKRVSLKRRAEEAELVSQASPDARPRSAAGEKGCPRPSPTTKPVCSRLRSAALPSRLFASLFAIAAMNPRAFVGVFQPLSRCGVLVVGRGCGAGARRGAPVREGTVGQAASIVQYNTIHSSKRHPHSCFRASHCSADADWRCRLCAARRFAKTALRCIVGSAMRLEEGGAG